MKTDDPVNQVWITGVSSYNVRGDDYYVNIDTSANAVSVYLPPISGFNGKRKRFVINDYNKKAATNNITIYPSSIDSINGTTSVKISTNGSIASCEVGSIGFTSEWITDAQPVSSGGGSGAIFLLGSLTSAKGTAFNMNSTADQLITLTGGTSFIVTDIVATNASAQLDTYDTIVGTAKTGSFLLLEIVTGSLSGSAGRVISTTGNNIVISTSNNTNPFQVGDVLTGATSGAHLTVSSVIHTTTSPQSLAFYTGTAKSGYQIASNSPTGLWSLLLPTNYIGYLQSNTGIIINNQATGASISCGTSLYASLVTAAGRSATADVYVYGYIIS